MTGTAPRLSDFGQMVEEAFGERDVLLGQPPKRRELIASIEAQGMTADEFRLVMRWWDRNRRDGTAGLLLNVLRDEANWRDVVGFERPRRDREEAQKAEAAHYPNMPAARYEPNPLIRELGRKPPFTDRDAVDGYNAGFGRNLLGLAHWLAWTDADEVMAAQREGTTPAGVERLRGVLSAAGIELAPEMPRGKKSRQKGKQADQDERERVRAARALAWLRIQRGHARDGDVELVGSWEPLSSPSLTPAQRRQESALKAEAAVRTMRSASAGGAE